MYRIPLLLCLVSTLVAATAFAQDTDAPARQERTPSYSEEGAAGCLRCHSGPEMRAIQSGPHFNLQNPGAPAAVHYCESCHGPGSIHVSRAHGGKGFPPLTEFGRGADRSPRDEQIAACLNCHGAEGQVFKTIGFIGSPHDRKNINCSTCHTVHAETDPIKNRAEQAETCYRCHRKQRTEHPRFTALSMDIDRLSCASCHDVHRPWAAAE
jgi:DmsE family decaheme c-type cytochrome